MAFRFVNKDKEYVKQIQAAAGCKADGICGPNTLKAFEDLHCSSVIQHKGKLVPIDFSGTIRHNMSLDTLPNGKQNWYTRKTPIDNIVVHWGGLNNNHCFRVFYSVDNTSCTTSHFLIGRNTDNNELEVWQCLDTAQVAYHAGKMNAQSVGMDICMHPDTKYKKHTSKHYEYSVMENNTGRGPKECVDIDPELAEFAREFILALRVLLELDDKPVCPDDKVYDLEEVKQFSVVGHHNVSAKKWDVSPWADKLYRDCD